MKHIHVYRYHQSGISVTLYRGTDPAAAVEIYNAECALNTDWPAVNAGGCVNYRDLEVAHSVHHATMCVEYVPHKMAPLLGERAAFTGATYAHAPFRGSLEWL